MAKSKGSTARSTKNKNISAVANNRLGKTATHDPNAIQVSGYDEIRPGSNVTVEIDGTTLHLGDIDRVFVRHPHYVVYRNTDGTLHYAIREITEAPSGDGDDEFGVIWTREKQLESLAAQTFEGAELDRCHRHLADAISYGIVGRYQSAKVALDEAETSLVRLTKRRFTFGVISCGAIFILLGLALLFAFYSPKPPINMQTMLAISLIGGSVGTMLSALAWRPSGPQSNHFDPAATKQAAQQQGALRILYGTLSALTVIVFVRAGVVTSDWLTGDNSLHYKYFAIAVVAGFAERLATNLIGRVTDRIDNKD